MSYRQKIIKLFTFLGGLYFFLQFILPATLFGVRLDAYDQQISDGFVAIGAMAVGLGLLNLLHVHGGKIIFRRSGWINSVGLIAGLVVMITVTTLDWRATAGITKDAERIGQLRDFAERIRADAEKNIPGVRSLGERSAILGKSFADIETGLASSQLVAPPGESGPDTLWGRTLVEYDAALGAARGAVDALVGDPSPETLTGAAAKLGELSTLRREVLSQQYRGSETKGAYSILYDGLFVALGSAMFSLLGFYIAAAAYRAFRVRSAESALMMTAALLVMLGQIPFGLWIWEGFPEVRLWLLSVPSTAAFRAIKIGAAVAGLILAFRVWFSIESETFSREGR